MAVDTSVPDRQQQLATEFVTFRNRAGATLAACHDAAPDLPPSAPVVIMAPKYGETKKNNLQLGYYLAANGLRVIRFDLSHHVGESEGVMTAFTLPNAVDDILAAIDYAERRFPTARLTLFSASLSARCALRVAATDRRLSRVVCLVGVVNLQHTLREVYYEDIVGTFLAGRRWGVTDILGFNIDGETFLGSAVAADLHDLNGTLRDIAKVQAPVTYFYAERDVWVDFAEVRRVFHDRPGCRLVPVEGAMHEVRENPRAAEEVYTEVVRACLPGEHRGPIVAPDRKMVIAQNRRERERLRSAQPEQGTETDFWTNYLQRYELLEKADDYRSYLETIGRMFGPFAPGFRVLDAGCGNGLFGAWLWLRSARLATGGRLPGLYVGLELTDGGLTDSVRRHTALMHRQPGAGAGDPTARDLEYSYLQMDFDSIDPEDPASGLPFADHSFDRVCCSLVVSYLAQPEHLMAELYRVTRPGGVLVVSSMKPFCDLSEIYRGFIEQQVAPEEIEAARGLLRAAGVIKLKEEKGHYTFFEATELAGLATGAGFREAQVEISLGNQANVVRVVK
jgi:SAM-dependent methyltransferase/alpha-beta hydrolase superfamily lysophospholipase